MFGDDDGGLGVLPGTTINVDPASAWPIAGDAGTALGTGAGQHGVAPQATGGPGMGNPITAIWTWINKPFTQPISPATLALMVGVVIVAIIGWNLLLYHIRIAAESI